MTELAVVGGRVLDPGQGIDETASVLISDGVITSIEEETEGVRRPQPRGPAGGWPERMGRGGVWGGRPPEATQDASGLIVVPGLVDLHTHLYRGVSHYGIDADRYLLRAPLVAGSTWTAVDNLVVQQFELSAVDVTLVTPSGRFEHCVVVRNDGPLPNGARFVTEWTYAPGVGLVALRTFRTNAQGKETTQTSLTLVSYRLEGSR